MKNGMEPAYPHVRDNGRAEYWGMSKREEMATRILPEVYKEYCDGVRNQEHPCDPDWRKGIADEAVRIADALLDRLGW
jgi:hypothetical protein